MYHKTSYFIVGLIRSSSKIILRGHVSLANKHSYAWASVLLSSASVSR